MLINAPEPEPAAAAAAAAIASVEGSAVVIQIGRHLLGVVAATTGVEVSTGSRPPLNVLASLA